MNMVYKMINDYEFQGIEIDFLFFFSLLFFNVFQICLFYDSILNKKNLSNTKVHVSIWICDFINFSTKTRNTFSHRWRSS